MRLVLPALSPHDGLPSVPSDLQAMRGLAIACLGIGLCIAAGSFQPAYGTTEVQGRKPIALPQCSGIKAKLILNRALRHASGIKPLRIERIEVGEQTNFALHGERDCAGSMTTLGGATYNGTWSYERINDQEFEVKFSFRPSSNP